MRDDPANAVCSYCESPHHRTRDCDLRLADEDEQWTEEDYGGVEDGFGNIFSDADPGL
jgi:hypothetical protein